MRTLRGDSDSFLLTLMGCQRSFQTEPFSVVKSEPPVSSVKVHFRSFLSDFSPKPIAVAFDINNHTVMEQTIQKSRYNDRLNYYCQPVANERPACFYR